MTHDKHPTGTSFFFSFFPSERETHHRRSAPQRVTCVSRVPTYVHSRFSAATKRSFAVLCTLRALVAPTVLFSLTLEDSPGNSVVSSGVDVLFQKALDRDSYRGSHLSRSRWLRDGRPRWSGDDVAARGEDLKTVILMLLVCLSSSIYLEAMHVGLIGRWPVLFLRLSLGSLHSPRRRLCFPGSLVLVIVPTSSRWFPPPTRQSNPGSTSTWIFGGQWHEGKRRNKGVVALFGSRTRGSETFAWDANETGGSRNGGDVTRVFVLVLWGWSCASRCTENSRSRVSHCVQEEDQEPLLFPSHPRVLLEFEHACSALKARGLVDQTQGHRLSAELRG